MQGVLGLVMILEYSSAKLMQRWEAYRGREQGGQELEPRVRFVFPAAVSLRVFVVVQTFPSKPIQVDLGSESMALINIDNLNL